MSWKIFLIIPFLSMMKVARFEIPAILVPDYFLHVSCRVSLRCKYGMLYSSTNFFCDSTVSMEIANFFESVDKISSYTEITLFAISNTFLDGHAKRWFWDKNIEPHYFFRQMISDLFLFHHLLLTQNPMQNLLLPYH